MLNRVVDMRVEAVMMAAEAKQLKSEARRAIKYARRIKEQAAMQGSNITGNRVGLAYLNYQQIYNERMLTRREARLHHLARMLLKGQDYEKVESFTYEKVDADELADRVWQWDNSIPSEYVYQWLGHEAA